MSTTISRVWYDTLVDDDGSGTTGSVWDKADVDAMLDAVDAILAADLHLGGSLLLPTGQLAVGTFAATNKLTVRNDGGPFVESLLGLYNPVVPTAAAGAGVAIKMGWTTNQYHATIATMFEGQSPQFLHPSLVFSTMGDSDTVLTERLRIASGGGIHVTGNGTSTVESLVGVYNPVVPTAAAGAGVAIKMGWNATQYHAKIATVFGGQSPDFFRPSLAFYTMGDSDTVLTERLRIGSAGGLQVGAPTGGDKGPGTINVAGDLYKNNTAYTNPAWVFERAYTGRLARFADRAAAVGMADYQGLASLTEVEAFTRAHFDLPLMAGGTDAGLFDRGDLLLATVEEAYLHLFDLHRRLAAVEAREAV